MSDTTVSLRRKIASAEDLQAVVRAMKALAASSVGQYERSIRALAEYDRTIELGLGACVRAGGATRWSRAPSGRSAPRAIGAVVVGSDQGLVGQFNDLVAEFAMKSLAALPGEARVWAIGERVQACLAEAGVRPTKVFTVPTSVKTIGPLVGELLLETEGRTEPEPEPEPGASTGTATEPARGPRAGPVAVAELHLFYNRLTAGSVYAPVAQRLLPLDERWWRERVEVRWPTAIPPELLDEDAADAATLRALIREHLFISLFRACADSLASENASRLAAMQRADKNIDDLLEQLNGSFHRLRQRSIDEELFDVISGGEALAKARAAKATRSS